MNNVKLEDWKRLEAGRNYDVEIYPGTETKSAVYIGRSDNENVFAFAEGDKRSFVLVGDNKLMLQERRVSVKPWLSFGVLLLTKETVDRYPADEKSRLLKILDDLDANL